MSISPKDIEAAKKSTERKQKKRSKKRSTAMKVSGKQVFKLRDTITKRSQR
jgi:hypothetical protein